MKSSNSKRLVHKFKNQIRQEKLQLFQNLEKSVYRNSSSLVNKLLLEKIADLDSMVQKRYNLNLSSKEIQNQIYSNLSKINLLNRNYRLQIPNNLEFVSQATVNNITKQKR